MNIAEAKEQIKNAMTGYFAKDELGNYEIPLSRQRPVFLMGPPGIGKTAIMEQIAQELGVGLVSYSMTHHTRQSALGLPFISKKNYGGVEYDISEYTMSEIIASVYDMMEETGVREGILFLDEINCVSETLAPAMLQFLQFKIFGRHKVPEGWIVVTAGNPPEYNKSVREFDIVTWDRLKRIDVEPDFEIWKEYAYKFSVHPAVLTYLEIKKGNFYKVETTVNGKTFVTARGWDDLSSIIRVFERHNLPVDEKLIAQYLQNGKIAKDFAIYYDLFNKYRSDYQVDKILAGTVPDSILGRAMSAKFDERLSLLGLLLDAVSEDVLLVATVDNTNRRLLDSLKKLRLQMGTAGCEPLKAIDSEIASLDAELEQGKRSGSISAEKQLILKQTAAILARERGLIDERTDLKTAFNLLRADFYRRLTDAKKLPVTVGKELDNLFAFCERTFEDGNELIILVTELTANPHTANFISTYGCPAYFRHNKELLFYERSREIVENLELMDLG